MILGIVSRRGCATKAKKFIKNVTHVQSCHFVVLVAVVVA